MGNQRDDWQKILNALNDKIPEGVWITELTPDGFIRRRWRSALDGNRPGGAAPPAAHCAGTDEITGLTINGLYHANQRTEIVDPNQLREFVDSLADLPYFDIDKRNITDTLKSYTTVGSDNAFAQSFKMQLKLKEPISFKP